MENNNPIPPHFLDEWHPTLNKDLDPHALTAGSSKKAWWKGSECGHEWQTVIALRVRRNSPCPYCVGKKILVGFNDLSTTHPNLAKEWHPTKNIGLNITDFSFGSNAKVWWKGKCGHDWIATINSRGTLRASGCPACAGRLVIPGFNDLATTAKALALEWHPDKNGDLTPKNVTKNSNKKAWWLCSKNHEWEASINNRSSLHRGCPVCVGQLVIVGVNDFASLNPELASEWHPVKNGALKPTQVSLYSNKKVWWLGKCNHEWQTAIANRTHSTVSTNCPVCSGNIVLIGFNDITTTHPELASEWHHTKNGKLTPQQVSAGSQKKIWWLGKCGHTWETPIHSRTKGIGCPICWGRTTLKGFNDLETRFPELVKEWHPTKNGDFMPDMITPGSDKKVWWLCAKGHEWYVPPSSRTGKDKTGCRYCATTISRAENELVAFLRDKDFHVLQGDRKALNGMEIDIYVPDQNFGIEYNGLYWHTEEYGKDSTYHYNKWLAAKNAGIELVQVWEDQFEANPELVKRLILGKLEKASTDNFASNDYQPLLQPKTVNPAHAENFMKLNRIDGIKLSASYLGLHDDKDALVYLIGYGSEEDGIIKIDSLCSTQDFSGALVSVCDFFREKGFTSLVYDDDNCFPVDGLKEAGFTVTDNMAPACSYFFRSSRIPLNGTIDIMELCKQDSRLKFSEGMSAEELGSLNGWRKIWDAGFTHWNLPLQT